MKKNITIKIIVVLIHSIQGIACASYPPNEITLTDQQVSANQFQQVYLQEQDPISLETIKEAIELAASKKNPFIMALAHTEQNGTHFYHPLDATGLITGEYPITMGLFKNPYNNLPIKVPTRYYYIFSPDDKKFYFLTDSNVNLRNDPYNIFINRMVNYFIYNPEHSLTRLPEDQIKNLRKEIRKLQSLARGGSYGSGGYGEYFEQQLKDKLKQITQSRTLVEQMHNAYTTVAADLMQKNEDKVKIANFVANYFAHFPELANESWYYSPALTNALESATQFYDDLLIAAIKNRNVSNSFINKLLEIFGNKLSPEMKRKTGQAALESGRQQIANRFGVTSPLNLLAEQLRTLQNLLLQLRTALPRL